MTAERETDLVLRAMARESEAFDVLGERCRPWLYGLCLRLVRDRAAAEDLVQETLIRAFRDLHQLRDSERFRPWLSRVALSACRMHLRALASEPMSVPLPDAADGHSAIDPGDGFGTDEALARLGAAERRLLALFYGDGLSHAEVAEVMALSAAAVKSRLHRARERLRKEMLAMMTEDQRVRMGVGEHPPWKLRTILLVEPDEEVREAVRAALIAAGYRVLVAPTGEAALTAATQRRGQMLLLDKHCVEPHWLEVLILLQADAWSRENMPVGVFIDPGEKRDVILAWQAGAALCLSRPPDAAEVVSFVKQLERHWPSEASSPQTCPSQ